jgi:acyl-CoA dehydrogenase family member 9
MLTAGMVDRGGVDFSLETAACKVFASEVAYRASNEALQIAGGMGYSKESRYEQSVRDSRINADLRGDQRDPARPHRPDGAAAARRAAQGARQGPPGPDPRLRRHLELPDGTRQEHPQQARLHPRPPALEDEAELVASQVHALGRGVEWALRKHGKAIIERQYVQERLANAAIDLYLCTATLSRITAVIAANGVAGAKDDLDAARIFIPMAMRRARRAIRAIDKNQDDRLRALARRAYDTGDLTVPTPTDV